jgi:hypothetical protein
VRALLEFLRAFQKIVCYLQFLHVAAKCARLGNTSFESQEYVRGSQKILRAFLEIMLASVKLVLSFFKIVVASLKLVLSFLEIVRAFQKFVCAYQKILIPNLKIVRA